MIISFSARTRIVQYVAALSTVSALSACGVPSVFQTDQDFNKRVYAGGGVLVSRLEPDTSEAAGVSVDDRVSGGGSVFLGFDLNNRFAIEASYSDLGEASLSPSGDISYQVGGLSGLIYGFNNREKRLRREGLSAFGRLGVGALDNGASESVVFERDNDVNVLVGAGLEYGFTNGLAGRAEVVAHDVDVQYGQLSLLYRFGGSRRSTTTTAPPPAPQPISDADSSEEAQATPVPTPQAPAIEPVPADSDLDGVVDDNDVCPDSAAGLPVNSTGCDVFQSAEGINFVSGSDDLTEGALVVLADIAQTLRDNPDMRITIESHTDNDGGATQNLQLSRRRALSVARYLIDQGVLGSRLRPQAFGESQPLASNATPEGKAANRRVEFSVIE